MYYPNFRRRLVSGAVAGTFVCIAAPISSSAFAQDANNEYEEHTIDEIIVEGAPIARTVEQLAQPNAIIGGDNLTKKQAASIGETLSQELGVSSSYFGPVSSRPVIRGQFGERVRVLSNSIDSLDAAALSEDHAVSVDSIVAERIEIVRGPATLIYGSGAAGGLVNIIDNRIPSTAPDKPFSGTLSAGTDSATGREAFAGQVNMAVSGFTIHLDAFSRETDDIEIPGFAESALLMALEEEEEHDEEEEGEEHEEEEEAFGIVENTRSRTRGGAGALTWHGENSYFGVAVSRYDSEYGIPGHGHHEEEHGEEEEEEHEEEEEESVTIDLDQIRVDLEGEVGFGNDSRVRFRLGINDYEHVELEGDEIGTQFDTKGADGRIEWQHGSFGNTEGAFGAQFKRVDFNAVGEEAFVPPSITDQTSVFAFEEWRASDDWVVQGSARIERQTIDTPGFLEYSDTAFGASVGAIWSFQEDYSLSLNYALTERHPNATELYADGVHVAVDRVERGAVTLGNGVLDKEVSSNIDLTLRGENERIEWMIAAFQNNINDYIILRPTAQMEEDVQVFEYRQTDASLSGFEAEARIELIETASGHLHTRLFADYVRGEEDATGFDLPRMPPMRYGIGLHYTMEQFEAGVEVRYHAEQDDVAPNELPTDSYTLLNAELSYLFPQTGLYVFARGTNLSDEEARQHTSPLKDTVPLPGRSFQLGVRYDF